MTPETTDIQPRPLRMIANEMEQLGRFDPEAAHGRADDLLIEAIERLAVNAGTRAEKNEAARIRAAFEACPKWYA